VELFVFCIKYQGKSDDETFHFIRLSAPGNRVEGCGLDSSDSG
jgi:hypothetical protein